MTVLVTGSTGTVGSEVTQVLVDAGLDVRALTRSPDRADLPTGVTAVGGEMTDVDAMRQALDGVSGLFLLNAVTTDELTATLVTLGLAREAGVRDVVYLSVIHADRFTEPAHFAAKAAAERMIEDEDIAATILRPGYYMQNDAATRDALLASTYGSPVGNRSVLMVDTRDLGEVAARELIRRQQASGASPRLTLDVVDPEVLTGDGIAAIWAEVLDRPVAYGGDDLAAFEQQMREYAPGWMAYDMRQMMRRFQQDGMVASAGDDARLEDILGRPMRSYRDFARDTAKAWDV